MLIQVIGSLGHGPAVHCLIFVDALPLFPLSPSPSDLHVVVPLNGHELERMKLDRVLIHEDYDCTNLNNDVALLLLASPIDFSEESTPICLPTLQDLGVWQDCWAATWRSTTAGDENTPIRVLKKTEMSLVSRETCSKSVEQLTEGMLCAVSDEEGKETCKV
ncbi:serine protease 55 [Zootoca vivipara]|uniref:serine protease 55 n=1 Tax=Zootoca vivipara TaxID=8524 RepID=UPI00293BB5A5|nr:serine protease 55 [Zootoca vivipara]